MSTSVIAASGASQVTPAKSLVKNAKGEYTAASVEADQADAQKLALVKQPDGNYGTSAVKTTDATTSAAKASSAAVQAALSSLTLGG